MIQKNKKKTVFVCIGLDNYNIVANTIEAITAEDASKTFTLKNNFKAKEILGPFFKKRLKPVENNRVLKFSNETKKAIYDGCEVNAFILKEPEDSAYLVFSKRIDNSNLPLPKGTVIVPISELRFL